MPATFAALVGQEFQSKTSPDTQNVLAALLGDFLTGAPAAQRAEIRAWQRRLRTYCYDHWPWLQPEIAGIAAGAGIDGELAELLSFRAWQYDAYHAGELGPETVDAVDALASQIALALDAVALAEDLRRQQTEARFRSLVQNSSDVVTVIEPDGTIVYQSPSANRVFGLRPEESNGRSILQWLHPQDAPRLLALLADQRARAGTRRFDARWLRSDGSWADAETLCTDLLDDPNVRGVVLNTRDVSERKAFEEQLALPTTASLAFEDRLALLVEREGAHRSSHRLKRLLAKARLKYGQACLEDLDTRTGRGLEAAKVASLAHGEWLASHIPEAHPRLLPDHGHLSLGVDSFGRILDDLMTIAPA